MTVGTLSTDHSFQFDAITDLLTSLSFLFRQLAMTQTETVKAEDIKTDQQLKQKYEMDDDSSVKWGLLARPRSGFFKFLTTLRLLKNH